MNGSSSNDRALSIRRFEQRTLLETGRDLIESQDPAFILKQLTSDQPREIKSK